MRQHRAAHPHSPPRPTLTRRAAPAGRARPMAPSSRRLPPTRFEQRWSVWAAGYGGSQTTDGNAALGIEHHHQPRLWRHGRRRLSPLAEYGRGLCAGRRRHQFQRRQWRQRPFRPVPGRRLRASQCRRRPIMPARWPMAGRTSPPTAPSPSPASTSCAPLQRQCVLGPRRRRLPFRDATWIGITPYAAGQFTTFELPAYAEQVVFGANTFALAYGAKNVTASRSELGLRTDKSFAMPNSILTLRGRPPGRMTSIPTARRRDLPDAAGRGLRGQRRGAGPRRALTTASAEMTWRNGWSAAATFEGEFSERHAQLCRQGRRALRLVKEGAGAGVAVIACDNPKRFLAQAQATKQPLYPRCDMDCFAEPVIGRRIRADPLARNDGVRSTAHVPSAGNRPYLAPGSTRQIVPQTHRDAECQKKVRITPQPQRQQPFRREMTGMSQGLKWGSRAERGLRCRSRRADLWG